MRARHFHPPMFVSKPDPKWQGSEDKRRGLPVKWWVFSPLHCYHPLPPSSLSSPFKSVTHYMSGQCVCACARQEEWGEDARIELSLPLCVWPESHWVSPKQLRVRERRRVRERERESGVHQRVVRWREEGSSGGLREGEKVERERVGKKWMFVSAGGSFWSWYFLKIWETGWHKFKVLLKCSSVHIKIPDWPQTYEVLEWKSYLPSAVVTIKQFEGHFFYLCMSL